MGNNDPFEIGFSCAERIARSDLDRERERNVLARKSAGSLLLDNVRWLRHLIDKCDECGSSTPRYLINMLRLEADSIERRANKIIAGEF